MHNPRDLSSDRDVTDGAGGRWRHGVVWIRRLPFLLVFVHGHASGPDGDEHKETADHRQGLQAERGVVG